MAKGMFIMSFTINKIPKNIRPPVIEWVEFILTKSSRIPNTPVCITNNVTQRLKVPENRPKRVLSLRYACELEYFSSS